MENASAHDERETSDLRPFLRPHSVTYLKVSRMNEETPTLHCCYDAVHKVTKASGWITHGRHLPISKSDLMLMNIAPESAKCRFSESVIQAREGRS
ncbi:MAG: DNA-binding domain-containing protein [Candidatus Thorarchaeota archaeon]|nr:MAG: hypothetical protein DRO87_10815 [Candidatus Thorarchaeota archaeon]RLI56302.1 MAG: hypothetical protein DRP09_06720 [Candidatus Thorarchaeota archaeon]